MRRYKELLLALAPVFVAGIVVAVLLAIPFNTTPATNREVKKDSISQSSLLFTSDDYRNRYFSNPCATPFMGSSELSRIDAMHPAVLADHYKRDYIPFSVGTRGTASITHFFFLSGVEQEMENRKAVFIISPQWFNRQGISQEGAWQYLSKNEIYYWMSKLKNETQADRVLAKRLLSFELVQTNTMLHYMLNKVANGKSLSKGDHLWIDVNAFLYQGEDRLYATCSTTFSKWNTVEEQKKSLPKEYNFDELDQLAEKLAKKKMTNNPYRIDNGFYNSRIKKVEKKLKGNQAHFNYCASPEYTDFQLILNEFASLNMDVLFVIQPVNGLWMNYTGLSQSVLDDFSKKIKEQLTSQGFYNIVDFTDDSYQPYFLNDTIHIGYRGWLAMDETVKKFMEKNPDFLYKLDNEKYLSKSWSGG